MDKIIKELKCVACGLGELIENIDGNHLKFKSRSAKFAYSLNDF